MKKVLLIDGQEYSFDRIQCTERGEVEVTIEGQRFTFPREAAVKNRWAHSAHGGSVHLHLPFGTFWVGEKSMAQSSGQNSGQQGDYRSPMPGKVLQVLVQPGQGVVAGEPLLILEAMKMEYTITAHRDGVVKAINFSRGAQVAAQAILLEVEGDEGV